MTISEDNNPFRIVVYSEKRNSVGKYELKLFNLPNLPHKEKAEIINNFNIEFDSSGGGGRYQFAPPSIDNISPKNHLYTFDITENNTIVDIEVNSFEETTIQIFNKFYELIGSNYGNKINSKILKLDIDNGPYKLWVGTEKRNSKTKYDLFVVGKLINFKKNDFKKVATSGAIYKYPYTELFGFDVENNNTLIDFNISSEIKPVMKIYNKTGDILFETNGHTNEKYIIGKLNKGKYKLRITAEEFGNKFEGKKEFDLNIYGNINNFSKRPF